MTKHNLMDDAENIFITKITKCLNKIIDMSNELWELVDNIFSEYPDLYSIKQVPIETQDRLISMMRGYINEFDLISLNYSMHPWVRERFVEQNPKPYKIYELCNEFIMDGKQIN